MIWLFVRCLMVCLAKWFFCLKLRLQILQLKGFSFVWIIKCCWKLNLLELMMSPQTGQHLSSDQCSFICNLKLSRLSNKLWHLVQFKGNIFPRFSLTFLIFPSFSFFFPLSRSSCLTGLFALILITIGIFLGTWSVSISSFLISSIDSSTSVCSKTLSVILIFRGFRHWNKCSWISIGSIVLNSHFGHRNRSKKFNSCFVFLKSIFPGKFQKLWLTYAKLSALCRNIRADYNATYAWCAIGNIGQTNI